MSDYRIIDPLAGFPSVTVVDTAPKVPLGFEVHAQDIKQATTNGDAFGVFRYCRGSNVASSGQWVQVINGSAVLLASANAGSQFPIGVAAGLLSATNQYGFVQVKGRADYVQGTNTGLTQGIPHYIGATAGQLVSNTAAGQRVQGAIVPYTQTATSLGTNGAQVWDLERPFIAGVTASL